MVLIELTFPGGRYHATPWGRHVNEGAIEWPPSPWRLLRALIATYWRKCQEEDLETIRGIVNILAASPPQYTLPQVAGAHTRHYMPLFKEKTAKIFDAFLHIEPGGVIQVYWPKAHLDEHARATLDRLLEALGYLGRAEAWVEAKLLPADTPLPESNAYPAQDPAVEAPDGFEAERVLCPISPEEYLIWRETAFATEESRLKESRLTAKRQAAERKGKDPAKEKLGKTDADKIEEHLQALFPETLFDALHADTGELQRLGWSAAPGTKRMVYFRPSFTQPRTVSLVRRSNENRPTVVRFALAPDTVNADTRPRNVDTLYLGEQTRRALMSQSRRIAEERGDPIPQCAAIFSGKDAQGNPLDQEHAHAFFLPCDDDGDGRIDHIIFFAREGFSNNDLDATASFKKLWQYGGRPGLFAVYLGEGHSEDFGGFNIRVGQSPFLAESRYWRSETPYIPTRHPKLNKRGEPKRDSEGNWIDSPEMQLCAELERRGFPKPLRIAPDNNPNWRHFATRRKQGEGVRAHGGGVGFHVEFAEPVRGPIALGYGCHFGLGLFVAEEKPISGE